MRRAPALAGRLQPSKVAVKGWCWAARDGHHCAGCGNALLSTPGGGGQELPLFELLRGGRRVDTLSGPQATALRDKVVKHRVAPEEDGTATVKKKKKGKQAKTERQACGYTGSR